MKKVEFAVTTREAMGGAHPKRLRQNKQVPGVVYGLGKDVVHIQSDKVLTEKLFYSAGESTVITLDIDKKDNVEVLIHKIDFHPVTNEINHIDFMRIDKDKKVHTTIPLHFEGTSEGERQGGILIINVHELSIECLPGDLVHDIKVDLALLPEIGSHINLKDIEMPSGILALGEPEIVLAHIEEPKVVEDFDDAPAAEGEEGADGETAAEEGGEAPAEDGASE